MRVFDVYIIEDKCQLISQTNFKCENSVSVILLSAKTLYQTASSWNMGICLDTEQQHEEVETTGEQTRGPSAWAGRATPPAAGFPMQNTSHVKFEPPNCPVIFVLGGPGSGKVTHCDNLMQERRGVVHINMTDLLQQYAIGNGKEDDMQDFGNLSSKTVTEVLMLEMKMAPTAKTYLVSGYPRSMRDVAEYSDKIQTINGVVLVSWRQRVLERQIEYGARLGHVVLTLAKMELGNFYRHVMPVADYFDQANLLIAVNGERNPEEVYKDFRAAVLQILGTTDDQTNGISGIPGEIIGVEPAPERGERNDERGETRGTEWRDEGRGERGEAVIPAVPIPVVPVSVRQPVSLPVGQSTMPAPIGNPMSLPVQQNERVVSPKAEVIRVRGAVTTPPMLWVVGGPGSNKAALCQRAVAQRPGWTHYSMGQRLRAIADTGGGPASDGALARTAISGGELAHRDLVTRLVRAAFTEASRGGQGLVLDGYPRDLDQMEQFQNEFQLSPRMVLLDCSKLQLGRGRRDDSVAAFRRRLEVFRELSLPLLKALDQDHRLMIVDGDTDSPQVQSEFTAVLLEEMEKAEAIAAMPRQPPRPRTDMSSMQQFAHAMSRMGGAGVPGHANGALRNGAAHNGALPNGIGNGFLATNKVKPMIENATKIPTVSQMTHDDVRRLYDQSTGDFSLNTHI